MQLSYLIYCIIEIIYTCISFEKSIHLHFVLVWTLYVVLIIFLILSYSCDPCLSYGQTTKALGFRTIIHIRGRSFTLSIALGANIVSNRIVIGLRGLWCHDEASPVLPNPVIGLGTRCRPYLSYYSQAQSIIECNFIHITVRLGEVINFEKRCNKKKTP